MLTIPWYIGLFALLAICLRFKSPVKKGSLVLRLNHLPPPHPHLSGTMHRKLMQHLWLGVFRARKFLANQFELKMVSCFLGLRGGHSCSYRRNAVGRSFKIGKWSIWCHLSVRIHAYLHMWDIHWLTYNCPLQCDHLNRATPNKVNQSKR